MLLKYVPLFLIAIASLSAGPYRIQIDPAMKEAEIISQGLGEFNTPFFGHQKGSYFAVYLKDEKGEVAGGVIAWMRPGIGLLCIDTLWVQENLRNRGYGTELMAAAEAEGKKHGCTHAQLETLPFQAVSFYEKLGYLPIGRVEKLYGGHDAIYMRKTLK